MESLEMVIGLLTLGLEPEVAYGAFLAGIAGLGVYLEMRDAWQPAVAEKAPAARTAPGSGKWKPAASGI